jgi:hypothetical protein
MPDITTLILDDHEWFRRQFAAMDELSDPIELGRVWEPLAALLDVHAAAEEEIFYPALIRRGDDAEEETLDAIGDHNDIRDGVADAAKHAVGSDEWHDAVRRARTANSEHMAEEEDDGLADFRRNATAALRDELGRRFLAFKKEHRDRRGLDVHDLDPEEYVEEQEAGVSTGSGGAPEDPSLGIGSLKEH